MILDRERRRPYEASCRNRTTSKFTKSATESSYRKGAISILLLDGDAIVELMLERGIGVVKQPVYLYEIASEFFDFDGGES